MSKLRFAAGLVAGRLAMNTFRILGKDAESDRMGYLPVKICPDFIAHAARPKAVIAVTGTNGKTSLTNFIADMLEESGASVSCNRWAGNYMGAQAWCFLNSVNVLNKSKKDYIVMETDEGDSVLTYPLSRPDYILINNISRDSIFKNPNPDFIMKRLEKAMEGTPDSTLILNADDPVSCFLKTNRKNVYFAVRDLGNGNPDRIIKDFSVCPRCGGIPQYLYKNYGNIGKFVCPDCGLTSPEPDYFAEEVADDHIDVRERDGSVYRYPIITSDVYNVYNTVEAVALLRTMGFEPEKIAEYISRAKLPVDREERHQGRHIEVINRSVKNSNGAAASAQFESMHNMKENIALIMIMDEITTSNRVETITWLYDADFEFLRKDNIKQIIIGGERHLDYNLRCLLAGIDKERISHCLLAEDTVKYLNYEGIDRIYIFHDIYAVELSHKLYEQIIERID